MDLNYLFTTYKTKNSAHILITVIIIIITKHQFLCDKILFPPTLQNSLQARRFFEHEELQRMNCTNHFNVCIYKSVYMH